MLSKELRNITDRIFIERVEKENKEIIEQMYKAAEAEKSFIIYPSTTLSNDLIMYLDKQGFKLYGHYGDEKVWHRTYPQDDSFPAYNYIMINW